MSIFNKEATLIALNEKKTSEEYARRSFKKEYNFIILNLVNLEAIVVPLQMSRERNIMLIQNQMKV